MSARRPGQRPRGTARSAIARFAAALGTAAAVALAFASAVGAAGACTFAINGESLDDAPQDNPIVVGVDDEVLLSAEGPSALGTIVVAAQFWPLEIPARPVTTSESSTSGTVDLGSEDLLQGLYHVSVTSDNPACLPSEGWVTLAASSPFDSVAGKVGGAVAVIGAGLVVLALRSALAGRGGMGLAFIGGALAGLGALVVAQQAGVASIDAGSATLWSGMPGFAAAGVVRVAGGRSRRDAAPAPGRAGGGDRGLPAPIPGGGGNGGPARGGAVGADTSAPFPDALDLPTTAAGGTTYAEPPPSPSGWTHAEPPPSPSGWTHAETPSSPSEWAHAETPSSPGMPEPGEAHAEAAPDMAAGDAAPPPEAEADVVDDPSPAPPRESYPKLDAPDAVVADATFTLEVGLQKELNPDVAAAPLILPPTVHGDYDLTIQLLADGFERVDGGDDPWLVRLRVTGTDPYPFTTITLKPLGIERPIRARQVKALYAVGGQAMGEASRPIIVVDTGARLAELVLPEARPLVTLSTPRGEDAPDLTVRIEHRDSEASGTWWWQMLVPESLGIAVSSDPLPVDLGADAPAFLVGVIEGVRKAEGKPTLRYSLQGYGSEIAKQVPKAFWDVLAQVIAAVAPEVPAIQILSAEAHVPWELAVMPATLPLADPQAPRYLGAQADVGRWVLGDPPPRVPPPGSVRVSTIAAISGVYPGVANLEEAEAEAEALETTYHAEPVDAQVGPVVACLSRDPSYDVVHFSVHADYGATAEGAGLVAANPRVLLADGTELDEATVRGFEPFAGSPFVFLNACQVGSGRQVLGDYAGMAAAFLYSGAAGVVAPLWSVDDAAARAIGLRFYERVLSGTTPAAALRLERASFLASPETSSSTFLAYQFYGHPRLQMEDAR